MIPSGQRRWLSWKIGSKLTTKSPDEKVGKGLYPSREVGKNTFSRSYDSFTDNCLPTLLLTFWDSAIDQIEFGEYTWFPFFIQEATSKLLLNPEVDIRGNARKVTLIRSIKLKHR